MQHTASYSPDDNKLRLYPAGRLDPETYAKVKAAGFAWAPKQGLFVAGKWSPGREDLLLELCGEIGDEDTSLTERAEERAERFEEYSEKRGAEAEQARAAVSRIADNIPLGQPILVGHHSEKHARKDAQRIENGMRRAVNLWKTSTYWTERAAGALAHASYKERPDVRARRIRTIEADKRRVERTTAECEKFNKLWQSDKLDHERAVAIANFDHVSKCFTLADYPRQPPASQYEGMTSLWSALTDGIIRHEQAREIAVRVHTRTIANCARWLEHYNNRLAYERAMLAEAGGTVADKTGPEKGGACRCWASPGYGKGWSYIQKVNRVSVTVWDNWGNGGRNFRRVIPFDKLQGIMTAAQVAEHRAAGRIIEDANQTGFFLRDASTDHFETRAESADRTHAEHVAKHAPATPDSVFQDMANVLRAGNVVQVVSAPQLFPTPPDLAARMVELAEIEASHEVLEPSAGTGALLEPIRATGAKYFAVEINHRLCDALAAKFNRPEDAAAGLCRNVLQGDFLECNGQIGTFDRVVMNPPFSNAADIQHIKHAAHMLKPGGRLVAICANGPRQQEQLKPLAGYWEDLPAGTFKKAGTGVNTALLVIQKPDTLL